jgi:hypothetical protein
MTARDSRNVSNSKNESNNRSANTLTPLAKAGTLETVLKPATACRKATTAGTPFTSEMTAAAMSTVEGPLDQLESKQQ